MDDLRGLQSALQGHHIYCNPKLRDEPIGERADQTAELLRYCSLYLLVAILADQARMRDRDHRTEVFVLVLLDATVCEPFVADAIVQELVLMVSELPKLSLQRLQ